MAQHEKAESVSIADFVDRQLDELARWGAGFTVIRKTDHVIELEFAPSGARVVIRISNATPNKG